MKYLRNFNENIENDKEISFIEDMALEYIDQGLMKSVGVTKIDKDTFKVVVLFNNDDIVGHVSPDGWRYMDENNVVDSYIDKLKRKYPYINAKDKYREIFISKKKKKGMYYVGEELPIELINKIEGTFRNLKTFKNDTTEHITFYGYDKNQIVFSYNSKTKNVSLLISRSNFTKHKIDKGDLYAAIKKIATEDYGLTVKEVNVPIGTARPIIGKLHPVN